MNVARAEIRKWVLENAKGLSESTLDESTSLLGQRHITSLQVPDLLLLIESVRESPIDLSALQPGDLASLGNIYQRFLDRGEP